MVGGMKRLARMPKTTSQPFHVPERPPSTENITQQVSHPAVETHCALGFCFNCGVDVVYDCLSFGHIWQPCFHIDCCVVRYACCSLLCHFVGVRYLFGTSGWFFFICGCCGDYACEEKCTLGNGRVRASVWSLVRFMYRHCALWSWVWPRGVGDGMPAMAFLCSICYVR